MHAGCVARDKKKKERESYLVVEPKKVPEITGCHGILGLPVGFGCSFQLANKLARLGPHCVAYNTLCKNDLGWWSLVCWSPHTHPPLMGSYRHVFPKIHKSLHRQSWCPIDRVLGPMSEEKTSDAL